MCGIYGYVGKHEAKDIILSGLKKLEYRGYDSAGLAVVSDDRMFVRKKAGKISEGLEPLLISDPANLGTTGIGHTRWATHGEPSDANAHPHTDKSGRIAVVHNGIIENVGYLHNRIRELQGEPRFSSGTDSEALAWLIGAYYEKRFHLSSSVADALSEVDGDYAIAVACADWPGMVVCACKGLPLVVGIGDNERFLSSDAEAIREHTLNVVYLRDGDLVALTPELQFGEMIRLCSATPAGTVEGFPHAMLKEIHEQPEVIRRISSSSDGALSTLHGVEQIFIPACGTSRHAALIGKYLFEELAGIPTQVDYASEFRYTNHVAGKRPVILALSQSGETADTLACVRESRHHWTLAICNTPGSTLAREARRVIYLDAGPEIGVAATKTFTAQLRILASLSVPSHDEVLQSALAKIPEQMELLLAKDYAIQSIAAKYANAKSFFFLGRGYNYPIALEGALKLQEISYIHAQGLPAGEMKHGPLAMIDSSVPSVIIIPNGRLYSKTFSNLREIKSRGGPVIALATEGNDSIASEVDDVIWLPETAEQFVPMLAAIPLQLLAYHIAVALGRDVDKPRNLAKSVTVE